MKEYDLKRQKDGRWHIWGKRIKYPYRQSNNKPPKWLPEEECFIIFRKAGDGFYWRPNLYDALTLVRKFPNGWKILSALADNRRPDLYKTIRGVLEYDMDKILKNHKTK